MKAILSIGAALFAGCSYEGMLGSNPDAAAPPDERTVGALRDESMFMQQAYLKASNARGGALFGNNLALSGNGSTLAVGAFGEAGRTTGIDGDQAAQSAPTAGAVYVFTRSDAAWSQQAYVKASNTEQN